MNIIINTFAGLLIPFLGTSLGAAGVFFLKKEIGSRAGQILNGFSAGVMIAASVWSLLIPAIEECENLGMISFLPAAVGTWLGVIFLSLLEHLPSNFSERGAGDLPEGSSLLSLAVTIHNIPEGMAVGIVYAGVIFGGDEVALAGAFALSIGIAIQNIPEGAIISMPLFARGKSKPQSFAAGVLSGAIEPIAGALAVLAASVILPAMPYFLGFAAGAMIYVVVAEMIPEVHADGNGLYGTISFAFGFTVMMCLDVALG